MQTRKWANSVGKEIPRPDSLSITGLRGQGWPHCGRYLWHLRDTKFYWEHNICPQNVIQFSFALWGMHMGLLPRPSFPFSSYRLAQRGELEGVLPLSTYSYQCSQPIVHPEHPHYGPDVSSAADALWASSPLVLIMSRPPGWNGS